MSVKSPREYSDRVGRDNASFYLKQLEKELRDLYSKREKVYRETQRDRRCIVLAEYKVNLDDYDARIKVKENLINAQKKKMIVSEMDCLDEKLVSVKNLMEDYNVILVDEILAIKERLYNLKSVVLGYNP